MPISINNNEVKKVNYNNIALGLINYSTTTNSIVYCTAISIKTHLNKQTYDVGETLDTTGLTLYAHYGEETIKIIKNGFICSPTVLSTEGQQTITVAWGGQTVTFNVTVKPPELISISVQTNPTKTEYDQGDTLNTSGLTLTATYSNGATSTISSGFTCSPTSITSTTGSQTITVTYSNKTTTFNVSVPYIVYTFPNSSKHFPVDLYSASSTYCGITVSFVNRNSVKNSADKAFDMSNDTFFAGTISTNSVSATTGVHIVFPFSICVKSVSISNPYTTKGYTNSNKHGLRYGNIYLRANSPSDTASTFATIQNRSVEDNKTTSYDAPPSLANSYVKCVSVIGTNWGATDWHSIGRVSITFKARRADLVATGLM